MASTRGKKCRFSLNADTSACSASKADARTSARLNRASPFRSVRDGNGGPPGPEGPRPARTRPGPTQQNAQRFLPGLRQFFRPGPARLLDRKGQPGPQKSPTPTPTLCSTTFLSAFNFFLGRPNALVQPLDQSPRLKGLDPRVQHRQSQRPAEPPRRLSAWATPNPAIFPHSEFRTPQRSESPRASNF
jgi:hypothetical protein